MAPILINRAPWNALIDDSGNDMDGTPWDKAAIKTVLLDPIDVALADVDDGTTKDAAQDATIANNTAAINANTAAINTINTQKAGVTVITAVNPSGAQNDYALAGRTKDTYWQWDTGGPDLALTGIAGGAVGDRLLIKNASGATTRKITLAHQSAASAVANRFFLLATSAPTPIGPGGWAELICYGNGWILIDHCQGGMLAAPFSAAYFGTNTGAWNVAAGDVAQLAYELRGRVLLVFITIAGGSSVVPASSQYLYILNGGYGGFVGAPTQTIFPLTDSPGGAALEPGLGQVVAVYGLDRIALLRPAAAMWPAGATSIYATAQFQVA